MQITLVLYIYACKLKNFFTQHFFTTFSKFLSPTGLILKIKFCTHLWLSWVHAVVVLHGCTPCLPYFTLLTLWHCHRSRSHFYFTRYATLEGKSLYKIFKFFQWYQWHRYNARLERKYLVWKMVTIDNFLILHCRGQTVACKCSQIGLGQGF